MKKYQLSNKFIENILVPNILILVGFNNIGLY